MKKLPKELYRYFWDIDPTKLDITKKDQYVISRVLQWGRMDDLRWLKTYYGKNKLMETLKQTRELSDKRVNFYVKIWGISPTEVLCLQPEFRRLHRQYWSH